MTIKEGVEMAQGANPPLDYYDAVSLTPEEAEDRAHQEYAARARAAALAKNF